MIFVDVSYQLNHLKGIYIIFRLKYNFTKKETDNYLSLFYEIKPCKKMNYRQPPPKAL
jgi:hypothetical protein